MKVSYFREMKNHHLVVTAGEYLCPQYQIKMVQKNDIRGLIRPEMRQMDDAVEYDYLITGCQSLRAFCEAVPLSGKILRVLVEGLCGVIEELERYMIEGDYLSLQPEFIYLKRDEGEICQARFCLFPFQTQSIEEQVRELLKVILNEVDYQEKSAVDLAYELFQEASQETIDWGKLRQLVLDLQLGETGRSGIDSVASASQKSDSQPSVSQMPSDTEVIESEMILQKKIADRKKMFPAAVRTEEILWIDEGQQTKVRHRKNAEKKYFGKREITLPEHGKKGILKAIGRG